MSKISILPATWEVPAEFRHRLGAKVGRQRAMAAEGHLLLVAHVPPKPGEHHRSGRFFWRKPDGAWQSSDLGAGPAALEKHLAQYRERLEKYDLQDEDADTAAEHFEVLEALSPLQRAIRNFHAVLQDARKLCPGDRELINARDHAYDLERTSDLIYHGAKHSLDYLIARRAEEQAHSSHGMAVSAHRLNVLVAFFFPLATLATIFGANLSSGLDSFPAPIPLLLMIVVGLASGALLSSFIAQATRRFSGDRKRPDPPPRNDGRDRGKTIRR